MSLSIPDKDQGRLALLMGLPAADMAALRAAIHAAPPQLRSVRFIADIQARLPLDRSTVREVTRLLLTLHNVLTQRGLDATRMAQEICTAAKNAKDERLHQPVLGWDQFSEQLAGLLAAEHSLGVTAKATIVAFQYPFHFHEARIMTDARPVFTHAPTEGPAAFMVIHTLALDVHASENDHRWFVALDSNDLRSLRDAIDRAIAKEESLVSSLDKTGIPTLRWREDSDGH